MPRCSSRVRRPCRAARSSSGSVRFAGAGPLAPVPIPSPESADPARASSVRIQRPISRCRRIRQRRRSATAGGLVLRYDRLRDPAAVRDRHTVGAGPHPQLDKIEVALRLRAVACRLPASASRRRTRPALASSGVDIALEGLAERRGVLLRQVDLVARAVQGERDRLSGLAAVEIINQLLDHFSGHVQHSLSTEGVHNLGACARRQHCHRVHPICVPRLPDRAHPLPPAVGASRHDLTVTTAPSDMSRVAGS